MRILFDQGTPAPLRRVLASHQIATAFERGWSAYKNGELLTAAEREFDLLITTDRNLRHQQRLTSRHLSILVLPTTSWPRIQRHVGDIEHAIAVIRPGDYRELTWPE